DDGGIYRLASATAAGPNRVWVSLNGNLSITELNSLAYDPLADVLWGGTQDVGSQEQRSSNAGVWQSLNGGDGNSVGVAVVPGADAAHTRVVRYSMSNNITSFSRRDFNGNGQPWVPAAPAALLRETGKPDARSGLSKDDADFSGFFQTPLAVN